MRGGVKLAGERAMSVRRVERRWHQWTGQSKHPQTSQKRWRASRDTESRNVANNRSAALHSRAICDADTTQTGVDHRGPVPLMTLKSTADGSYAAAPSGGGSPDLVNAPDDCMNLDRAVMPLRVLSSARVPRVCGWCLARTCRKSSCRPQSRKM